LATILANAMIAGHRIGVARLERMFNGNDRELLEAFMASVSGLSPAVRGELVELGKGHDEKDVPGYSLNQAGIDQLVNKFGSGRERAVATAALALACHAHNLLTGKVPGLDAVAASRIALLVEVEAAFDIKDPAALDRLLKGVNDDGRSLVSALQELVAEGRRAAVSQPAPGDA
jgi:hypothetical protein